MSFIHAQESIAEAAVLISRGGLEPAARILTEALKTLGNSKFAPQGLPNDATPQLGDIWVLPISRDGSVSCCQWDEDYFVFPFAVFDQHSRPNNATDPMTEQVALACATTCLFLLGLCWHLRAHKNTRNCEEALRNALSFYGHAWMTLKKISRDDDKTEMGGLQFLRMAICSNLSHASHQLGEVVAANAWLLALKDALGESQLNQDEVSCELYEFFLLTSTVNTGFVAAGAA